MRKIFLTTVLLTFALPLAARQKPDVKFEYDVNFEYKFDNREFDYSSGRYTPSCTINSVLLTPSVGLGIRQNDKVDHRLMLGVDIRKDIGTGTDWNIIKELTLYYDLRATLKKGRIEGVAGIFPRSFLEGDYSEALYSDSLKFEDRNLEGLLIKYRSKKLYAELGLDWMGRAGYDRKERFNVLGSVRWNILDWMGIGMDASFYHYAGSQIAPGVVDNNIINPYIRFDLAKQTGMQELSLKAGALATYQRDRERTDKVLFPCGGEAVITARRWNVCLQNTTYFGSNLQVYYDDRDLGGNKYGSMLYFGLPFYRGFYDRLELVWKPHIADWLVLQLGARAHFSKDGFLGWQQVFGVAVSL